MDSFAVAANGEMAFVDEPWVKEPTNITSLFKWGDPDEVPLCIGVVGAPGTGKKKLATDLAAELDIPVIKGLARVAANYGAELDKDGEILDQLMIFMAQLWQEREFDEYITAGTMVEAVAHAHYVAHSFGGTKELALLTELINLTNSLVGAHYAVVFYLPYKKRPRKDGVRSTDNNYNLAIDALILHYLRVFDLDYLPLTGTRDERSARAMEYLSHFGLL